MLKSRTSDGKEEKYHGYISIIKYKKININKTRMVVFVKGARV
tara:strand:- start:68 stop:196 length:129 start_codon:yes stop_codon:yes gene_type:complete